MAMIATRSWCSPCAKQFNRFSVRDCVPDSSSIRSKVRVGDSISVAASQQDGGGVAIAEKGEVLFNGRSRIQSKKEWLVEVDVDDRKIELLEDDTKEKNESVKDYLDSAKEFSRSSDDGPPRWFCPVECGRPMKNSPLLLFLPGLDGTGLGLIAHHKALGRIFEVRCMHIPILDRTPFEGLLSFVEDTLRSEHGSSQNRPIYLVGDSLGGCLALAVAARNPNIDLVLILSNPATSFSRSPLQPIIPLLEVIPDELHVAVPYLLSLSMGDPVKMAMVDVKDGLPILDSWNQLSEALVSLLPRLSVLAEIIPKQTLVWKIQLLRSASSYTNSRLHAVKAETLVLASGKDNLLPSREEAERLWHLLPSCRVRYFKDHGHTLLLEDGINLVTIIKATCIYRRSRVHDYVQDYIPLTLSEFIKSYDENFGLFVRAVSPAMYSTLEDGKVVRGLDGIPDVGPVLFVGYHMLMGLELSAMIGQILKEKNILVRGVAHPQIFSSGLETPLPEPSVFDAMKLYGPVPVSAQNLFRLLSTKSFVLLYPGGAREALHRKGEAYKLIWPEKSEFVRMAARFEAKIVPFAVVGEDDIAELVLDYNDLMNIPVTREWITALNSDQSYKRLRADASGELANQDLHFPGMLPKVPGRFYFLFGKPIDTSERQQELKDRDKANEVYLQVKSEVENMLSYLIKKREEDPYRSIVQRSMYQATRGYDHEIPSFEP